MFSCKYWEILKKNYFEEHHRTATSVFIITNLIESRTDKLILNHLIGNNRPEFRNRVLGIYFFKLTVESGCSELYFWAVACKTILAQ